MHLIAHHNVSVQGLLDNMAPDELPKHPLAIGAERVDSELTQGFRRLGSRVTMRAGHDRLLPCDDPTAS